MEAREVYVGGQKFREAVSRGINSQRRSSSIWPTTPKTSGSSTPAIRMSPTGISGLAGRPALRGNRRPVQPQRPGQPPLPAAAGARRGARPAQRARTLEAGIWSRGRDHRLGLPVFHAQGTAGPGPQGEPGPPQLLRTGLPQPVLHAPLRRRVPDRQHAGPDLVRDAEGRHELKDQCRYMVRRPTRSFWPT